jgi:hypothetical protein
MFLQLQGPNVAAARPTVVVARPKLVAVRTTVVVAGAGEQKLVTPIIHFTTSVCVVHIH